MPTVIDINGLLNVALGSLPSIFALIRQNHAQANPAAPALTDEQCKAGLALAVSLGVGVADRWLAAHPSA